MRQVIGVIALAVLAACESSSPPPAASSPSPPASAATGLSCQLPVVVGSTPGFITFPAGSFKADPQAKVVRVSGWPFAAVLSYDRAHRLWLTVPRWLVSSDGSQYLFRGSDGSIDLATVSTGGDRVLASSSSSPSGNGWFPVGMTDAEVYIAAASDPNGPAPAPFFGLWSVNLDGTGLTSITESGVWTMIGSGAAWGVTPQTAAALNRLDLSTGTAMVWVAPDDGGVFLYDVDTAGDPLVVVVAGDSYVLALVTAKNTFRRLGLPDGTVWGGPGHRVQNGLVTRSAIWLTVDDGSILFSTLGKGFSLASNVPGVSNVAGECD
jgi:hypothetical protein